MDNNNSMNAFIEHKNAELEVAGKRLKEIYSILYALDDVFSDTCASKTNITRVYRLAADKISSLSCIWTEVLEESQRYLPEAEQEPEGTIDNDEPVTEDDLPFDGKENKE